MVAWRLYKQSMCPGCGHPKATAWHPDNGGAFEVAQRVVCHACTAKVEPDKETGAQKPVEYLGVEDTRDYEAHPLPIIDDPEEE